MTLPTLRDIDDVTSMTSSHVTVSSPTQQVFLISNRPNLRPVIISNRGWTAFNRHGIFQITTWHFTFCIFSVFLNLWYSWILKPTFVRVWKKLRRQIVSSLWLIALNLDHDLDRDADWSVPTWFLTFIDLETRAAHWTHAKANPNNIFYFNNKFFNFKIKKSALQLFFGLMLTFNKNITNFNDQ